MRTESRVAGWVRETADALTSDSRRSFRSSPARGEGDGGGATRVRSPRRGRTIVAHGVSRGAGDVDSRRAPAGRNMPPLAGLVGLLRAPRSHSLRCGPQFGAADAADGNGERRNAGGGDARQRFSTRCDGAQRRPRGRLRVCDRSAIAGPPRGRTAGQASSGTRLYARSILSEIPSNTCFVNMVS